MLASIDVGSNTVRMLIGQVTAGRLEPDCYERAITRLGGAFSLEQGLAGESMERTLLALQRFAAILRERQPSAVRMVGTEALRRAGNREEFIRRVQDETGLQLEVIDGQTEARLSARGVLQALDPQPRAALVIDIGGGSTELILLEADRLRFRESYPLGVVRLCEESGDRMLRRKTIATELDRFQADLSRAGLEEMLRAPACELVGTAGTVTSLAAIDLHMEKYDWRKINNHLLPSAILSAQYAMLEPLSVPQREQIAGLEAGRGDLIMPGIEILLDLAERFSRPHLRVSDFGLLEGILLDLSGASID